MNLRICGPLAITAFVACLLTSAQSLAQNAYITNSGDNTVSVINTATNTVIATIPVGDEPFGVAATHDGSRVYTRNGDGTVSVIDTATNTVTATIPVPPNAGPATDVGVAVSPDGSKVYVATSAILGATGAISVIDAATNTVTATIPVGVQPEGVAVAPDGSKLYVYVANYETTNVSVIDAATNTVTATIPVDEVHGGNNAFGVAVTPDGSRVYVTKIRSIGPGDGWSVSAIDTATNTVIAAIVVNGSPFDVAVSPDGTKAYVSEGPSAGPGCPTAEPCLSVGAVLVISTATNGVIATVPVGGTLGGVSVTPDNSKVYVANSADNSVSVIDTATNAVVSTIPVGNSPVAFGVFIPIPVPQSAPVAGNLCNGIYEGTFNGNLTVSAGQDCIFLNGRIGGNVNVVGGNFALNGSSVGGNLTVNGGGTYTLGPAATVGGNLQIQNIPSGSANNSVCGATVNGNLVLKNDGTAVQIGSTAPLFCAGNTIGGSLEVVDNFNSALMFDNSVGGNISVVGNTGPVDVVSNTARGNLLCQNNPDLIMGGGNTATRKTGQCN